MVRYIVPETVIVQQVLEEMVLLDSEQGGYWELNQTATEIFTLLSQGLDREEALALLQPRYQVDPSAFAEDFQALVQELVNHGLLTPSN